MTRPLPPRPNLLQLKHQAKDLRKAQVAGDVDALSQIRRYLPRCAEAADQEILAKKISLQEAQHVVACEYGFKHWEMLCAVVEADIDLFANLRDREAQHIMRQIDQKDMTAAMIGASAAVQDRFLLNMSSRVRGFIRAEMEMSSADAERIEQARRRIVQLAAECAVRGEIEWPDGTTPTSTERISPQYRPSEELRHIAGRPLDQLTRGDLQDLFSGLATQAQREGILSLVEYADSIDDPFLRMGLQLVVDGTEPALVRDLLETRLVQAILPHQRTRGLMVIEGAMAVYSGDNPLLVRHKLAMFIAQPSPDWSDIDLQGVTVEGILAALREKSDGEMTLEEIADLYACLGKLAREKGIEILAPLPEEMLRLEARDLTSEMLRHGLDLLLSCPNPDQIIKGMKVQLEAYLDSYDRIHRQVIEGLCAIQEGKSAEQVAAAVRAAAEQVAA
jgi:hypothetical protein